MMGIFPSCRRLTVFTISIMLFSSVASSSEVTYLWPKVPLEIDIAVGSEQRITVTDADSLQLGVPQNIRQKLTVEIIGNHFWLTAKQAFSPTRLVLLADPVGRIILQVRAQDSEQFNQSIVIQTQKTEGLDDPGQQQLSYSFVKLTRWVVQQLYAPKRLLKELPGVQRLEVDASSLEIFRCAKRIPTACANAVTATPVGSWQSQFHFITALEINNNLAQPLILDPRELRGTWRSAAFVHSQLHARGHPGDTTVLVLISDYPFETSLL